jgi:hypothetical protein
MYLEVFPVRNSEKTQFSMKNDVNFDLLPYCMKKIRLFCPPLFV